MNPQVKDGHRVELAEGALVSTVPTSLAPLRIGQPYRAELTATGGQPPYTWTLREGELPEGLRVEDGVIRCSYVRTDVGRRFLRSSDGRLG